MFSSRISLKLSNLDSGTSPLSSAVTTFTGYSCCYTERASPCKRSLLLCFINASTMSSSLSDFNFNAFCHSLASVIECGSGLYFFSTPALHDMHKKTIYRQQPSTVGWKLLHLLTWLNIFRICHMITSTLVFVYGRGLVFVYTSWHWHCAISLSNNETVRHCKLDLPPSMVIVF